MRGVWKSIRPGSANGPRHSLNQSMRRAPKFVRSTAIRRVRERLLRRSFPLLARWLVTMVAALLVVGVAPADAA